MIEIEDMNYIKRIIEGCVVTQGRAVDPGKCWPYLESLGSEGCYNYDLQISLGHTDFKMFEGARILSQGGLFQSKNAYRYYGNILLVSSSPVRTLGCLLASRHLPVPHKDSGIKNRKLCGYQFWSERYEFTESERERIERIVKWLENGLCLTQTYTYAIYFRSDEFAVVFRDPELQVQEYLIQQLAEAAAAYDCSVNQA